MLYYLFIHVRMTLLSFHSGTESSAIFSFRYNKLCYLSARHLDTTGEEEILQTHKINMKALQISPLHS